jgi:hypothetical protein
MTFSTNPQHSRPLDNVQRHPSHTTVERMGSCTDEKRTRPSFPTRTDTTPSRTLYPHNADKVQHGCLPWPPIPTFFLPVIPLLQSLNWDRTTQRGLAQVSLSGRTGPKSHVKAICLPLQYERLAPLSRCFQCARVSSRRQLLRHANRRWRGGLISGSPEIPHRLRGNLLERRGRYGGSPMGALRLINGNQYYESRV